MLRLPVIETARAIPIVTINPDASSTDPSSSCTAPPCIVFLSKGKSIGRSQLRHKESAPTQIEAAERSPSAGEGFSRAAPQAGRYIDDSTTSIPSIV
jgi:hypothetical protein